MDISGPEEEGLWVLLGSPTTRSERHAAEAAHLFPTGVDLF